MIEDTSPTDPILREGETCWKKAQAEKLTVIVDAADYFRHLRTILRDAKQTIYMIGWDLDLRVEMVRGEADENGNAPDGMPNRLGDFLIHVVEKNPEVQLYILKWDKAMLVQLSQQFAQTTGLKLASDRIHFALDSHHPTGAAHHQKIVVVDDALAFCGGIDVTKGRWDTREHAPDDPRRHGLRGQEVKPWHDVTTALSGPVARELGNLSRTRWQAATGDELDPPRAAGVGWPDALDVHLRDVEVAIARTIPDYRDQDAVDEIERLHLAAIDAAQDTIYLESQYFASGAICSALERKLSQPDGPELVVVNPDRAEGFVQHQVMDTGRARMIERVRQAAARGGGGADGMARFRIYHPVNAGGEPIYVHAKVLIVDDRLVRVGSSNVNNRSMGFDTECDVAFEPSTQEERDYALRLRHSLLAEHLGCQPGDVAEAAEDGSLIEAIDALNGNADRKLVPIDEVPRNAVEREMGERILFDERTWPRNRPYPIREVTHRAKRAVAPYQVEAAGAGAVVFGLAILGLGIYAGMALNRRRRKRFPTPAIITDRRPDAVIVVREPPR